MMNKMKARHWTEAAKPQVRVLMAGLLIAGVWIAAASIFS